MVSNAVRPSAENTELNDLITLNQIAETLNRAADVRGALNDALARLVELMGLDAGWIFISDENDRDLWAGKGYRLAASYNLPPAMALDSPQAWNKGCDCQGLCNKGQLNEAYNEVRCSRLAGVEGDTRGLQVHASTPLRSGDRVLGILNVAGPDWDAFSPRALALLTNVGSQMSIALERARLFDIIRERRIHEQAALLDFSNQLLGRHDLDDLMNYLVQEIKELLQVDACALLLRDENPEYLVFRAATGWQSEPVAERRRVPADDRSGSGRVMRSQQPLIIPSTQEWETVPLSTADWVQSEGFESAAIVPLLVEGRSIGTLVIDTRQPRTFTEDEIRFLQLMANQAALAIEKARLHQEEIKRMRLEEELSVGRQIQLSLLPKSSPVAPGWEFCDIYQAARQVGGDFYDFFELPDGRMGLVIADVADKGVPAALFMGVSRSLIRGAALAGRGPAAALERANFLIQKESQADLFLSAFYGILNLESGQLVYANAGHNPPLLYRPATGEFQKLSAEGIVLSVLEQITLEEKVVDLQPGDVAVFYTDGVTEAMAAGYEEFGEERLRVAIEANASGNAKHILWSIVNAVNAFTHTIEQSDDFTLFVVKRL
ncbi:MAG: SpoIIE family protein phosphatase [Chloroflexi bacterium]|nr:SpoIIE family protein phosphatase [Chloroflexota bacterium]